MNQSRLGARVGTRKPYKLNSRIGSIVPVTRYLAEREHVALDMLPEIPPPGLLVDGDQLDLLNATDYRETA